MSDPFGEFLVPNQVEEAVVNTLTTWYPTYLRRIETKLGLPANSVKDPQHISNRNSITATKGEPLPKVAVISPGLIGQPALHGRTYSATWRIGVGVAFAAQDEETANMHAKIYSTATHLIILHKRGLGTDGENPPFIKGIAWIDELYDDLPIDHQILLYKAAIDWFAIEVDGVMDIVTGPDVPDLPDYPSYGEVPDVEHIFIDVEKEENG